MTRSIALVAALGRVAFAEPAPPCEADTCLADQTRRPWILTDDCHDTSDVVGYRHCATFGAWAAAARATHLDFEAGLGIRRITVPMHGSVGSLVKTVADGVSSGSEVIVTSAFRVTAVHRGFYAGLEVELGDLTGRTHPYGGFIQGGTVLGAQLPLGRFDLGAEALLAGRNLHSTAALDHEATASATEPVIELRAHVQVWLSPWVTLGAELGAGVLDRSEWAGALVVGVHTRAFGGPR